MRSRGVLNTIRNSRQLCKGGGRRAAGAAGGRATAPAAKLDGRLTRGLGTPQITRLQNYQAKGATPQQIKAASKQLRDLSTAQSKLGTYKTAGFNTKAQQKFNQLNVDLKQRFPGL